MFIPSYFTQILMTVIPAITYGTKKALIMLVQMATVVPMATVLMVSVLTLVNVNLDGMVPSVTQVSRITSGNVIACIIKTILSVSKGFLWMKSPAESFCGQL